MIKLKWGQTPWDKMSKSELLREVQRMFTALESARSAMKLSSDMSHPFWSDIGSGGRALSKANQVIESIYDKYDSESVYRSFYRYAISLLFNVPDKEKWVVCSECGAMYSPGELDKPCGIFPSGKKDCKGTLRALNWSDLKVLNPTNKE